MSWIPPDLYSACTVYTTITTCQPSTFMFLELIRQLFGRSKDAPASQPSYDAGGYHNSFGFTSAEYNDYLGHNGFGGTPEQNEIVYDFIIVGAGSAGCVVANRLTEIPHWKVLLIEAGDEEPEVADVPAFAPPLQRSSIDWGYSTQPQPTCCLARRNRRCNWARGRVMGGSSTINYLIYMRGGPKDYDEWELMGNKGWSYRDVLPYFIKSERNRNPDKVDLHYHGRDGYQTVEIFPFQDQNVYAFLEAYRELGLDIFDQNGPRQIGASLMQHTTQNGERLTTNGAFIRPIRNKRKNLTILTRTFVIRVLIDPHSKTAFGVEYVQNGKLYQAIARKEVIVSGGSLNSPKVLQLSGIGPAAHLRDRGIHVLKDLPVGYNLHDHATMDGVLFALSNFSSTIVSDNQMRQDTYFYKQTRRGPLSSTGPLQVNSYVQTKYEDSHDRPDIQISIDSSNVNNVITDPILASETLVTPLSYYDGVMVRPILLFPQSRGVVLLNDSDPIFGDPLIYPNTFGETIDLLRMVEGAKQSLNLLKTKVLQGMGMRLVTTPFPACERHQFGSDEYWACCATSYTTTIFHPVGTCKMGPPGDETAVVDPHLRVYGIRNLRVIDASVMPKIPRGNTNAPTIMIAEKGSDMIKAKWLQASEAHRYGFEEFLKKK